MDYSYYTFWCKILLVLVDQFGVKGELRRFALAGVNDGNRITEKESCIVLECSKAV
jgi:hypothetical protein